MSQEQAFLEEILAHPKDEAVRLVYADWLEEQGDPRADFLRLEVAMRKEPKKKQREAMRQRLREMRTGMDREWLALMDQTRVENCNPPQFSYRCPKRWEDLRRADDDLTRFCDDCKEKVYFCSTVEEANGHALQGHCVAIDSREPRKKGDLRRRVELFAGVLGRIAPPAPRFDRGQRVRVQRGPLQGMEGVVLQVYPARFRASVLPSVGRPCSVELHLDDIEPVRDDSSDT